MMHKSLIILISVIVYIAGYLSAYRQTKKYAMMHDTEWGYIDKIINNFISIFSWFAFFAAFTLRKLKW